MLQNDFVPVAIDQWYQRQQDDAEGRFFQRIARQGPRDDMDATTQGFYLATAGGELLKFGNHRDPDRLRSMMKSVLARKRDWMAKPLGDFEPDPKYSVPMPAGTVVIQVNSKVLAGYGKPRSETHRHLQQAIGRDNLWIMPDEKAALLAGRFPGSLATRIARFHLVDNTRGEPPMWRAKDVQRVRLQLEPDGTIRGNVALHSDRGQRSYRADLYGKLETADGEIDRFDLVALGDHEGAGPWTAGAPGVPFPLAVAFRVADENDLAWPVLPQALKATGREYLK